jgi:hypothetical protein
VLTAGFGATLVADLVAGLAAGFVAALAAIFSVMVAVIAMTREAMRAFVCKFFVISDYFGGKLI